MSHPLRVRGLKSIAVRNPPGRRPVAHPAGARDVLVRHECLGARVHPAAPVDRIAARVVAHTM